MVYKCLNELQDKIIQSNNNNNNDNNFVEWQRSPTPQISAFRLWSLELELSWK